MTRNLKLAFLAAVAIAAPACIGGYAPGQDGTPPVDNTMPPVNQNNGGGGSAGAGGGGAGGGGGGGGTGTGGSAPSSARPVFDSTVAPIVMRCNAAACHGGTGTSPTKFAVSTPTLYDNILGYSSRVLGDFDKTTATVISKITAGGHNGMTYTAAEVKAIGDWLDAERTARASTGGTGTTSARELLLQKWSGCMVKTEWDTAGVAAAWAQKTTDTNNTACQQCHVNGQGFWANADSTKSFNVLTTAKNPAGGWFLEMYFTVDMTTNPAAPTIIINRDLIARAALGTAQHERFQIDTDRNGGNPPAMTRLKNFLTLTQTHLTAGTCGPNRLGTTPPP